ncbi:MAG: Smr/MutS family protein [Myxococcota bacterium]
MGRSAKVRRMLRVTANCLGDLGWPRVLKALASCCHTERAEAEALQTAFISDAGSVRSTYEAVAELGRLHAASAPLPLDGITDVRRALDRCRRGATASVEELVSIATCAQSLGRLHKYVRTHAEAAPRVAVIAAELADLGRLGAELASTFDASGHIRDDASPELRDARRRLASIRQNIKERLDRYIQRADIEGILQDDYYTEREERYVVPVIASFQSQVPGIIHGASQTGQTVFVEPEEFITANNDVKLMLSRVESEILRVLIERSRWVADEASAFLKALDVATALDLVSARALFAERHGAAIPEVATEGVLRLVHAKNPLLLLDGVQVVANDIVLDTDRAFVLVTGPNTGGKTVTLITVGLMVLMAHAAIPLPADAASRVVLFEALHAIIGDAQDIHRDLSTFSGHLQALSALLADADRNTLVLLDELIVGTEPERGAALAIAVLETLAARGARGFVTTHYERLKLLAYEDERFANASVGIDAKDHSPTYRLAVGEPGASSPFEIAERLGFDSEILKRARAIAVGDAGLAEAIERLRSARAAAEDEAREARAAADAARREAERLARERERIDREAAAEVAALRREARDEVRAALQLIREQVRDVREERDAASLERKRKTVAEVEARLVEAQARDDETLPPPPSAPPSPAGKAKTAAPAGPRDGGDLVGAPEPGMRVWVRSLNRPGDVVEARGRDALVAIGSLKMTVEVARLGRVAGETAEEAPRPAPSKARRSAATETVDASQLVPPPRTDATTLDLRGHRRDEVADQVERFLDHAWQADDEAVWIIHGHGTGAVRDEVRSVIARTACVRASRPGRGHEGGDGVTLAWLSLD